MYIYIERLLLGQLPIKKLYYCTICTYYSITQYYYYSIYIYIHGGLFLYGL